MSLPEVAAALVQSSSRPPKALCTPRWGLGEVVESQGSDSHMLDLLTGEFIAEWMLEGGAWWEVGMLWAWPGRVYLPPSSLDLSPLPVLLAMSSPLHHASCLGARDYGLKLYRLSQNTPLPF